MSENGKFYVAFLIIIAFVACNQDFEAPKHHRIKRYLRFQNGSRMFVSKNFIKFFFYNRKIILIVSCQWKR